MLSFIHCFDEFVWFRGSSASAVQDDIVITSVYILYMQVTRKAYEC